MNNLDISDELHIYRHGHGVKLISPDQVNTLKHNFPIHCTNHTVGSMLALPLNVYFIRADGINQKVNEQDALLGGFDSVNHAVGKTCFSEFTKESALITTQNDQKVMQSQIAKISEEDVVMNKTKDQRPTLSIKLPWYNNENKVVGLFGCSIILGKHPLADSLSLIQSLGLLNTIDSVSQCVGTEINKNYLSKRQLSCAKLLLLGLTHKEIALRLGLSFRTIEHYMEIMKNKLHCRNKTELTLKLAEIVNK